jgi:2-polyprenyl-3-methyl-5-hydroxy-6-metoxy-1,4-benzoquinol methylase
MLKGFKQFIELWKKNKETGMNQTNLQQVNGQQVLSPLEWNSLETANRIYSNREVIKKYLDDSRLDYYKKVASFLPKRGMKYDDLQIADVGCGTGHLLLFIAQDYSPRSLNGFDYSEEALKIARETLPEASFEYMNIYKGIERKFDVVFCLEVLEHLLHPERALLNLIHMIAPEGTLLITVPDGRKDNFEGHINFWSLESWNVFMEKECNGLQVTTGVFDDTTIFALIKKSVA